MIYILILQLVLGTHVRHRAHLQHSKMNELYRVVYVGIIFNFTMIASISLAFATFHEVVVWYTKIYEVCIWNLFKFHF